MINRRVLIVALTVATVGVAGLIWAGWNRGVTVIVRNRDAATLSDVTIHVTGREYPIGDVPPGSERNVLVDPTGESHIEIAHGPTGERARLLVGCYFEGGYSGTIEIDVTRTEATVASNEITVGLL